MRPGLKDWLWPIAGGFFMAAELAAIYVGEFHKPAVGPEALLFLFTMIGILNLWEKVHFKRNEEVPADVRALGGPILVQRISIIYGLGGLITVCGAFALAEGVPTNGPLVLASAPVVLAVCIAWTIGAAAVTGAGMWLLVSALFGWRMGHLYLAFEPAGLRVGTRRYSYLLHWDNLAGIHPLVRARNTWLFLAPIDAGRLVATLNPSSTRDTADGARLAAALAQPDRQTGSPLSIMPRMFGVDAGILSRAIQGYAADPGRCTLDLDPTPAR